MKNKLLTGFLSLVLLFGLISTSFAQGDYWKLISGKLYPIVNTWQIGSSATRIAKAWLTDLDVSGTFTLGGIIGSGGMDLNGEQLILDEDGDLIFQAAINNILTLTGGDLDIASAGGDLNVTATTTSGTLNVGSGKLYVGESGNVGIGTLDVSQKLTVYGGDLAITTDGTATTTISSATSTFAHGLIVDTNSLYVLADTGFVGIGTKTPTEKLHINGDIRINSFVVKDDSSAQLGIRNSDDSNWANLKSGQFITAAGITILNNGYPLDAANTADGDYNHFRARDSDTDSLVEIARMAGASDPYFSTGGSQQFKFFNSGQLTFPGSGIINTSGNFGIGTTTPRYKLDVWGDLAIGTSTGTNVPALYIDSGNGGQVAIGTTTLSESLQVNGYALFRQSYGSLSEDTEGTGGGYDITLETQGTFYGWKGSSSTISEVSGSPYVTMSGGGGTATSTLTIGANGAGKYQISMSVAMSVNGANQTIHCAIFKNGVKFGRVDSESNISNANDVVNLADMGIASLQPDDVLDLRCANASGAGNVLTIRHASLDIVRIGLP